MFPSYHMPTTMSRLCTSSRCLNTPVSISRMWKIFYIKIFLHIHHKLHHHKNIQWCIVEGIPSIFIKMCTWKIITPMKEKLKNFFLCMCVCVWSGNSKDFMTSLHRSMVLISYNVKSNKCARDDDEKKLLRDSSFSL